MRNLGDTERCRCRWKTNMLCFVNAETPFWPQKWGPWGAMFVDQLGHWSHPIWQSHLRPWGSARWTNPTRKQHLNCAVVGTTPGIIKNSNKGTSLGSSRSSCSRCRAHLRSKTSLRRSGFHFQAAIPLAEIEETPENVKSEVWQHKKSDVRQGDVRFAFVFLMWKGCWMMLDMWEHMGFGSPVSHVFLLPSWGRCQVSTFPGL